MTNPVSDSERDLAAILAKRERARIYYQEHREAIRERKAKHYAENREVALERARRRRDDDPEALARSSQRKREAYAKASPAVATGPYTEAEDRLIVGWGGTDIELAIALGRTYTSVRSRKVRLRSKGLLQ